MASSNIGKWNIQTSLDASGVTSGANRITGEFAKLKSNVVSSVTGLGSAIGSEFASMFSGGILGGLAAGSASGLIGGIKNFITETVNLGATQDRLSRTFGVTNESAAAFMSLAQRHGMEVGELTSGLQRVQAAFGDIRQNVAEGKPLGDAGVALSNLNIQAREFVQMPFDQQLFTVGDALRNTANESDRASAAHALLGREWRDLLPVLMRGSEGFEELRRRMVSSGMAAGENATQIRQAQRAWREGSANISAMWGGVQNFISQRMFDQQQALFRRFGLSMDQLLPPAPPRSEAGQGESLQSLEQKALGRSIDEVNRRLTEQTRHWGLSAEEATRADLVRRGATDAQLRDMDKRIARLRQWNDEQRRATQDTANLLRLQEMETTPFDRVQRRMREIEHQGEFLSLRQRGAALLQAIGGLPQQSPLLGSLEAGSAEVGSILQAAITPEIDQMAAAVAQLQAIAADAARQTKLQEDLGNAFDDIRTLIDQLAANITQ